MDALAERQIAHLSGGQQQRVLLARALAQEADLYLMDEPFAGVDAATEDIIISLLKTMTLQEKTVAVVHHDLQSAAQYFDWCVLLNMHVVASGVTKEIFTSTLLQKTYGGKLTILSSIGELLKEKELSPRKEEQRTYPSQ